MDEGAGTWFLLPSSSMEPNAILSSIPSAFQTPRPMTPPQEDFLPKLQYKHSSFQAQITNLTATLKSTRRESQDDEKLFSGPKRTYTPRRTLTQKLDSLFDFLTGPGMSWTIGDLMFNLFRFKDDTFSPSARHGQDVEKFLSGRCQHHPGMVLNA
ncbi:hypothetical protein AZE42_10320 [Rhizopogon vesiculosus]|uniref:Uncharacterized protein n=1 Tax=Rhizopogon vesiculosus TaxID=180088 RepID=A0A1J8QVD1_9AGAM|nr:hypothetical protein AZE42_10320 [Rhizopogon vesiculosus]